MESFPSLHIQNPAIKEFKVILKLLLVISIVAEILFFPSLANLYGCFMAVIALWVFSYFFKEKYIVRYPFAFCMYLSMFMYRFLPLIATIVEGKPITFGFERPYETFLYEILLFLVSSLAFYISCPVGEKSNKNSKLTKALFSFGFFKIQPLTVWIIGVIGISVKLYNLSRGEIAYGDVVGKFFVGLEYFMYAPIMLLYPTLTKMTYHKKKLVIGYIVIIMLISLAANKRHLLITPVGTIALLFFLSLILNRKALTSIITPAKLVFIGLFIFLGINFLSNISLAMLHTRDVMLYDAYQRKNADKLEAFQFTLKTMQNETLMGRLRFNKNKQRNKLTTYVEGWTEYYIENFMLERYANMRITDETLYYASKKGFNNKLMLEDLVTKQVALIPTPILSLFDKYIDKSKLEYSRGDFLAGFGFGGYRVTSHVGDGLATFGYWYFPIQFFTMLILFYFQNSFVYISGEKSFYAPFAIMNIFSFLGMFRNATGISGDLSYIFRGYFQDILLFGITIFLINFFVNQSFKEKV